MTKNIFLIGCLLAIGYTTLAQEPNYRLFEFYEGYIIKKDGSRERGYIQYIDESDRYEKVIFKKEHKSKKQSFKPKDIGGYKVADVVYHAVQFEDVPFKNSKFLILENEGCLSKYNYRQINEGAWSKEVIIKNGDMAIATQKFILGFSKRMSELIEDDKELAAKVSNKEKGYGLFNLDVIIDEYNANCAK